MTNKEKSKKSKELAFLLRHDTEYKFDKHGWREVSDLVKNHGYTKEELADIVATDEKGRYEWNDQKTKIRARQGHSINVDVELKLTLAPDKLYHGTSSRFMESIKKSGLLPMSRQYVHLSEDIETAKKVGTRHGGKLVILEINTKDMMNDGYEFYLSANNVWLTKNVPWKYCNVRIDI